MFQIKIPISCDLAYLWLGIYSPGKQMMCVTTSCIAAKVGDSIHIAVYDSDCVIKYDSPTKLPVIPALWR
jgi:hypothetical protein